MGVREPGQRQPGQQNGIGHGVAPTDLRHDSGEPLAGRLAQDVRTYALVRKPGQFGMPAAALTAGHADASSSSAAASAATPVWQSASSACSAGACETPDGLRTNSIAAGTRAASTAASCPAPVR